MKKPYSLDYSIDRDTDRLLLVQDILDKLERTPSATDLEQMATYILYGKDENGQSSIHRGEVYNNEKRYNTYKTSDDHVISLDELLENPMQDEQVFRNAYTRDVYKKSKPTINKPKYDKDGNMIDPGDSDIPGMVELWERIDYYEKWIHILTGKLPPDENFPIFEDDYRLYKLKHNVIDIKRHQYYLKDAYKPEIHFQKLDHPKPQFYNWASDSAYWITYDQWKDRVEHSYTTRVSHNLKDYETRETPDGLQVKWVVCQHNFDWENPKHIHMLIKYYDAIKEQLGEKLDTYGRTLLWDLERYIELADFTPYRLALIQKRIKQEPYEEICLDLAAEYGVSYNAYYLSTLMANEIPKTIARTATKLRLLVETPIEERKKCNRCGQYLPRHPLFFTKNSGRKDGLQNSCRECERKRRIERGEQDEYDRRKKDPSMRQV